MSNTFNDNEAAHRESARTRNAARAAALELERERQAPRVKAKARAEDARASVLEALGTFDPLPVEKSETLARFDQRRKALAQTTQARFDAIATALGNPNLTGPEMWPKLADQCRNVLEQGAQDIGFMRSSYEAFSSAVAERLQRAKTPPPHVAPLVVEARAALRNLPESDRYRLMAAARGDLAELILYAVGAAPGLLSGVAEGKHVEMRRTLLAVGDPDLLDLEPAVEAMGANIAKAEAGLRRLIDGVADFEAAEAVRALGRV